MRVKMTAAALALAALLIALPGTAAADVIKVRPGQSIQAAIDAADPGDTIKIKPGTYRENVVVAKDDLRIVGSGWHKTRIVPPDSPAPVCDFGDGAVNGICVTDFETASHVVANVHVSDLAVNGFSGTGVLYVAASGAFVHDVWAEGNVEYGIAAFASTGGRYAWNTTPRNGEAGIYLGDSPRANSEVHGNTTYENEAFGIFIRDASFGEVTENRVFDNCVGILLLNTGGGNAGWSVKHNRVVWNDRACPAEEEGGIPTAGILVGGAGDAKVLGNEVLHNGLGGGPPGTGGLVVFSTADFGGADASNVLVAHNKAFGNTPFDLLWDEKGTGNRFVENRCRTSSPGGLCERRGRGGKGHHGGGKHGHKHKKHKHEKHKKHDRH